MNPRYALTALRAGRICEYCRAPEAVFNFPFEVEHIVPVACDGPDQESNWALSCRSCNLRKGIHLNGVDPESGRTMRLYDPRRDRWARNFRFDTKSGRIEGTTRRGRATAERLGMNSEVQMTSAEAVVAPRAVPVVISEVSQLARSDRFWLR